MRILVISGAGISAESGIPTFRGKDGYWRKLNPATLATPEAFARDPKLVWEWYQERRHGIRQAEPNAAHRAIVQLAVKARDFLLVTQNVDDLHMRAEWEGNRLSSEQIVQVHGDIFVTRCSECEWRQPGKDKEKEEVAKCPECGALMRPGVVWFGELLDERAIARVENFLSAGPCDVVLVVGTTAMFGYIVDWAGRAAGRSGRLIEINPEATSFSALATECVRAPAAVALPKLVEELLG